MTQQRHADLVRSGLSRRDALKRAGLGAGVAAGLGLGGGLALPGATRGATATQGTARKVVFVNHDNNPFFVPVRKGLEQFAAMAGWETQFTGPAVGDTVQTVELQRQAIASQPDAVGFTRIDTTSFDENIREAQRQGIFVILFNTESEGYEDLGVAFVGQRHQAAAEVGGYECARNAQELTGKTEGKVVMGIIQPGHSALEARHRGYEAGIARYNEENGTSYTTEALETSTDGAKSIAAQQAKFAAEGDQIVAFAHADFGHQFTAQFIRENGLQGRFANGGFDLLPDVLTAIKSGEAQWTVGQNPFAQGWVTSALIHMNLENGYEPSDHIIGADLVTTENIDAVMEREAQFAE